MHTKERRTHGSLTQARVQAYENHADLNQLEDRVRTLNAAGRTDSEIAAALNAEGLLSTRGTAFNHRLVHLLRKRWNIATVKINAGAENPPCWPDGTYSVQGAAHALGVTAHTIFAWLKSGRLAGHHLAKGMPWQITLTDEQIPQLQSFRRRTSPSRRQAS